VGPSSKTHTQTVYDQYYNSNVETLGPETEVLHQVLALASARGGRGRALDHPEGELIHGIPVPRSWDAAHSWLLWVLLHG
jgi:hypothetical protein